MEIVKVKLTELKPYENNPRINDEAAKEVAKSIKQCGYVAPIIVDENMVILAGHTRLKALQILKRKEAECLIKSGLTEEQKRKYRLLDNKTGELAEWDFEMLASELEDLDFLDLNLDWGIFMEEEPDDLEQADEETVGVVFKITFENYKDYQKYEDELKEITERMGATHTVSNK